MQYSFLRLNTLSKKKKEYNFKDGKYSKHCISFEINSSVEKKLKNILEKNYVALFCMFAGYADSVWGFWSDEKSS